MQGLWKISLRW